VGPPRRPAHLLQAASQSARQPSPASRARSIPLTSPRGEAKSAATPARPRAQVDEAAKTLPEQRTRPENAVAGAGAIGAFL